MTTTGFFLSAAASEQAASRPARVTKSSVRFIGLLLFLEYLRPCCRRVLGRCPFDAPSRPYSAAECKRFAAESERCRAAQRKDREQPPCRRLRRQVAVTHGRQRDGGEVKRIEQRPIFNEGIADGAGEQQRGRNDEQQLPLRTLIILPACYGRSKSNTSAARLPVSAKTGSSRTAAPSPADRRLSLSKTPPWATCTHTFREGRIS